MKLEGRRLENLLLGAYQLVQRWDLSGVVETPEATPAGKDGPEPTVDKDNNAPSIPAPSIPAPNVPAPSIQFFSFYLNLSCAYCNLRYRNNLIGWFVSGKRKAGSDPLTFDKGPYS